MCTRCCLSAVFAKEIYIFQNSLADGTLAVSLAIALTSLRMPFQKIAYSEYFQSTIALVSISLFQEVDLKVSNLISVSLIVCSFNDQCCVTRLRCFYHIFFFI